MNEHLSTQHTTHFVISFTLHTSQRRKLGPRESFKNLSCDEWLNKMWYIYKMEHYSVITKKEAMPFAATWMDLEMSTKSEVLCSESLSGSDRDRKENGRPDPSDV